mmetsp:Transcript_8321/g.14323  ORF Transcript_8321/g.14323 Transcript_8321/m.14323 type:complete len:196 (-) Transcript_8321:112-699(-)
MRQALPCSLWFVICVVFLEADLCHAFLGALGQPYCENVGSVFQETADDLSLLQTKVREIGAVSHNQSLSSIVTDHKTKASPRAALKNSTGAAALSRSKLAFYQESTKDRLQTMVKQVSKIKNHALFVVVSLAILLSAASCCFLSVAMSSRHTVWFQGWLGPPPHKEHHHVHDPNSKRNQHSVGNFLMMTRQMMNH